MPRKWKFQTHDESLVKQLCHQIGVSPLTAQVLISRGYQEKEKATQFLNPKLNDLHDPETLPGVPEGADRVVAAIQAQRKITIYGDYDVDGMSATSILWKCLKLAGGDVHYYIPSRQDEGYGLNCDAIREFHSQDPEQLIITVDCGISSIEEAKLAKELGLELIITDHHQMASELPDASCLIHPRLPGSEYAFGELCGAGVAFKLAWAICTRLGDGTKASPRMREFLKSSVGLAALGTVADVVPLVDENRIIVRYGLFSLIESGSPGINALLNVAGLEKNQRLAADDIGFAIAPRLNAAGRLGQARLAVELLTTDQVDRADQLSNYLDQLNNNRKTVERRIFKQAREQVEENEDWLEAPALVLAHHDWNPGIIGIVANRIAEHFEKPAILISINQDSRIGQGSGRSFANFDLHAALNHCTELLESHGGHKAAAGLKVHMDHLDAFREKFCQFVSENHNVTDKDLELSIDAEVRLQDVTRNAVLELSQLGPFGASNPNPVFSAVRIDLSEPPRTMGEGDRHLAIKVNQHGGPPLRAIAFGRGEWAEEIQNAGRPLMISFEPNINRFRGRESVELRLIDWQADELPS